MQTPEVIRREWPGFGECRITIAPFREAKHGSLADRVFAGVPRLLSRTGFGSLSFTIDPDWIGQAKLPAAAPVVRQFLRAHRGALAEEWKLRQSAMIVKTVAMPVPMDAASAAQIVRRPRSQPVERPTRVVNKNLPSWYETILRVQS